MAQVNIKIDDQLKDNVTKVFNEMGLDLTTGIKMYLKRVEHDRKIPFEVKSPVDHVDQLANDYQSGNPQAVKTVNKLFNILGEQSSKGASPMEQLFNNTPHNGNGIGGSILKNRKV